MSEFPLTFCDIHNRMPHFMAFLMTIPVLIGMALLVISEMFHRSISLNSVLLLLLVNFVSGFRSELMYISLIESIRSSLTHLHGFQLLLLLPQFVEITFCLYQKGKSSESKVKFKQASNSCKRLFEAAKLAYANKQRSPLLPRNLALGTFGKLLMLF